MVWALGDCDHQDPQATGLRSAWPGGSQTARHAGLRGSPSSTPNSAQPSLSRASTNTATHLPRRWPWENQAGPPVQSALASSPPTGPAGEKPFHSRPDGQPATDPTSPNGAWLAVQVSWPAAAHWSEGTLITKTLRRRVFALVGRITRSARRLTLHLPRRWPWETQFSRALARLQAIPFPA